MNQKKIKIIASITLLLVALTGAIYWLNSKTEDNVAKDKVASTMNVQQKKARFKTLLVPAVEEVYTELTLQYQAVTQMIKSGKSHKKIAALKKEYKATNDDELLMALKPHPKSIALAQAAMESSWATSRFFNKANNVFGVWSFDSNEPRIAAGKKRGKKTIWLKKYPTIKDSIRDYYRVLARGSAFTEFRKLKMTTSDPYKLVGKLDRYSEKGAEYGQELAAVIRFNKFDQYDQ